MPKFKLLQGRHIGLAPGPNKKSAMVQTVFDAQDPKVNVIETDEPLDEMFANKFKRLDEETKAPRNYDATFDKDDVMDAPLHVKVGQDKKAEGERKKDTKIKEVSNSGPTGKHVTPKGKTKVTEDYADEDDDKTDEEDPETDEDSEETETEDEGDEESGSAFGEDVTDKFESAGRYKAKVFEDSDGEFTVVSEDDEEEVLNKDKLTTSGKVKAFLKTLAPAKKAK